MVREKLWLLFVRSAGPRLSMTNHCSAICAALNCPRIRQKKPENIVRIAQQKLLTGKQFPVPRVVLSFLQKSLKSHRSVPPVNARSVVSRLLMRAGIIVIHAAHTYGIPRQETCLRKRNPTGSKTGIKQPVIIPGIHLNTETRPVTEPGSIVAKRKFDIKNPDIKKMGIVIVVIVGIALLAWAGSMLLGSGPLLPSDTDVLITQDLDSITLTLIDLPSGWMSGDAMGTEDAYSAQFFTSSENSEALVEETITRFPGIEEARLELNSEREQVSGLPVETINLGNGGFGYIDVNYVMVIFRRGNIIVKIEDTRTEYQENPTMNNAKNYAQIVAGRIK